MISKPKIPVALFLLFLAAICRAQADVPMDFDGDGRTDFAVVRNVNNQLIWYIQPANGSANYALQWGSNGDVAVPEDYDGDGRDDIAVWRPTASSAFFYILQSQTNTFRISEFGLLGDDPSVMADYDGDNRSDIAIYRNASPGGQSRFYYLGSQNNPNNLFTVVPWGTSGDFPVHGDYDGDGRGDFAIQRNVGGQSYFFILQSTAGVAITAFGLPTDLVAPGDYDGDGRTDLCVVRRNLAYHSWWIRRSSGGAIENHTFGLADSDFLAPGDYTGDGRTDLAVWRPNPNDTRNFFYVRSSAGGSITRFEWGIGTDYPAANVLVH